VRFFFKSLLAIAIATVVAGLLTYPAWLLVSQFADYRPDRVMRRVGTLALAIALLWILRREGLADRTTLGYGLPRRQFLRQMTVGFLSGLLLMMPLVAVFLGLGIRNWNDAFSLALVARTFLQGALIGFAVSFVEETFLRGAMYGVIERESGAAYAILLPSLLFAAVHFIADPDKMRVATDTMSFQVGLQIAARAFVDFAEPLAIVDALFALAALGVLLSLIRRRTGAIAGSIGLHAGGVAVIFMLSEFSAVNSQTSYPFLIGSNNGGIVGWLAFAWISVVALAYWRLAGKRIAAGG